MAILSTKIRIISVLGAVAVFQPGERCFCLRLYRLQKRTGHQTFIERASAHVEAEVRLSANQLTPLHEFVRPDGVRFILRKPGQFWSASGQSMHDSLNQARQDH